MSFKTLTYIAFVASTFLCCARKTSSANEAVLKDSLRMPTSTNVDDFPEKRSWIDHYGAMPDGCIYKTDINDNTRAVFKGCYDWHSCVHGYWALFRMDLAGTGKQHSLAEKADTRLRQNDFELVWKDLSDDPKFELPYGRAWFLRMADEEFIWARKFGKPLHSSLKSTSEKIADSILEYYKVTAPTPTSSDYINDSWSLAQLYSHYKMTGDAKLNQVSRLIADHYTKKPFRFDQSNDNRPSAFFSWYWGWVYVIATSQPLDVLLNLVEPEKISQQALTPIPDPGVASEVHHLGMNWSRAWAIKALSKRIETSNAVSQATKEKIVAAYQAHAFAGRERHFKYRGNYYAYDHWVPQFAVYAISDKLR